MHAERAREPEQPRVALELDLRNIAVVNAPNRAAAHLGKVGFIPAPGERNTDESGDNNHQHLVVLAHDGDHKILSLGKGGWILLGRARLRRAGDLALPAE